MNKRFSFVFTITLVIVSLAFAQNQASAQYFNKYYTWASEKHMWPGEDRGRLPFAYENINLVVKGNFSGFQYHGVNIPALVYLVENKYNIFEIYAVESRGFRTYDPIFSYGSPGLIQQQEGIALDSIGIIINGETALDQAYTEHPTVRRFRDQNNNFPNFDSIKFAVSGNFYGCRKDEIMVVYNNPNGQQQFYFLKVNLPGDTLNYQFEIDASKTISQIKNINFIDISTFQHVVAGNFDNDSLDEIAILNHYNSGGEHNKLYVIDWNGSTWSIMQKFDMVNYNWNNESILNTAVGNLLGDGRDEIACLYRYGTDSTATEKLLALRFDQPWYWGEYLMDRPSDMIWERVSNMVAGNFDNDTTNNETLAIFYDPGDPLENSGARSVQKVYFTNQASIPWTMTPRIFEHRDNMSFSKDKLRFAVAGNFDYDIKGRDDLLGIYLGDDTDGQDAYTFKKALLWTCLPAFEENNFMIYADYHGDTLRWDQVLGRYEYDSAQVKGNFIPLGTWGPRLSTTYIDPATGIIADSICHNNTDLFEAGKIPERDIDKFATIFNCVIADRETFTDHDNIWVYDKRKVPNTSSDLYDGYVNGFNNYLNAAQRHHLKVIPEPLVNHLWNYDDFVKDTVWSGDKVFCNFGNFSTYPEYFKNIFADASGAPRFHPSLLGWFCVDEPTNIYCHRALADTENYLIDYNVQFTKHQNLPITQDTILHIVNNIYKNTPVASIDGTHSLVKIVNFDKTYDMDYYSDGYDVAMCDDGYIFKYANKELGTERHDLTWKINNLCKYVHLSIVRNNKKAGMYIAQAIGASGPGVPKANIKDWINPTLDDIRYSLFSPAIDGIRGAFFFHQTDMLQNDTVNGRVFLASAEFKNYLHIFMQKPLYAKVSSNLDRLHKSDYTWLGSTPDGWERYVNYCLIKDSVDNIYYLFVSSCHWDPQSINFTVNVDPGTPNAVYELAPDYHKNGLYDNVLASYDDSGQYFKFGTTMTLNKVRIFTIGGLPTLRKPTISESIGLKGYLSFSNQRKLIAYPARQSANSDYGSTDTLRYHAVYHKLIPNTARWGVYYRRSNPMVRRYPQDMIDWEPTEALISNSITTDPSNPNGQDNLCDCKYPSLVVRYDSLLRNKPIVYVVYSCDGGTFNPLLNHSIVEKQLPANDPVQINDGIGTIIAQFQGDDLDKWGTPTINASYGGNYYAWSDSLEGIVTGWKRPNMDKFDTQTTPFLKSFWNETPPYGSSRKATHPCLNTYSRINLGEDDCALVWQESMSPALPNDQIYYSRVRLTPTANLQKYLPLYGYGSYQPMVNSNRTIARLTDTAFYLTTARSNYPVIYRGVETYYDSDMYNYVGNDIERWHNDLVYWQSEQGSSQSHRSYVFSRLLELIDDSDKNPETWMVYHPFRIYSLSTNLYEPTISQGCLNYYFDNETNSTKLTASNDSVVVVNFRANDLVVGPFTLNYNYNALWQVRHSYRGLFLNGESWLEDENIYEPSTSNAIMLSGSGRYPQLAAMPAVLGRGEWLANRRLFETGGGWPPDIASSLQYFYKRSAEDFQSESSMPFLGFIKDSVPGLISSFRVTDERKETSFIPRFETHKKKAAFFVPADTIQSAWFKMKDMSRISFYTYGRASSFIELSLERKKDGKILPLPIEFRGDTFYVFHDYSFIGSKNDKYRLRIIKKAAGAHYLEEMLLGGLPGSTVDAAGDTTGGLFKAGERLYDLRSEGEDMAVRTGDRFDFYLYPNPASEELYVRCNYPAEYAPRPGEPIEARAEFTLYNSLGQAFGAYSSELGGFIQIDATSLQPGLYYIKGRIVSSDYIPETPAAAVSKPVVIVR